MHIQGLTQSWSSSACSDSMFPFHQGERHTLAATARQGRNRDDPKTKWFGQLPGTSPKSPPQPEKHKQQDHHHHPGTSPWPMALLAVNPRALSREYSPTLGTKNLLAKVESSCSALKLNKEARAGGKKGWLYFRGQQ